MKYEEIDNVDPIVEADIYEISKRIENWSESNLSLLCSKILALDHVPPADEVRNIINEIEAQIMEKLS